MIFRPENERSWLHSGLKNKNGDLQMSANDESPNREKSAEKRNRRLKRSLPVLMHRTIFILIRSKEGL